MTASVRKALKTYTYWHPRLKSWESKRPDEVSEFDHERAWEEHNNIRRDLQEVQQQMKQYLVMLAQIAGVPHIGPEDIANTDS